MVQRKHVTKLARFINISLGSFAEVEYLLDFSKRLGLLLAEEYKHLIALEEMLGKLLWSFYKKVTQ